MIDRDGCCLIKFSNGREVFYLQAKNGYLVEAQKDLYGMIYRPISFNEFPSNIEADENLSISEAISELAKLPNDSEVAEDIVMNASQK